RFPPPRACRPLFFARMTSSPSHLRSRGTSVACLGLADRWSLPDRPGQPLAGASVAPGVRGQLRESAVAEPGLALAHPDAQRPVQLRRSRGPPLLTIEPPQVELPRHRLADAHCDLVTQDPDP